MAIACLGFFGMAGCRDAGVGTRVGVLLVGLDGATWTVIGPMLEAGELPAFRRLMTEGAYMRRFETMDQTDSPLVWTSVATGVVPTRHGVTDYTERLESGRLVPVTSNSRKVKALWNVASENGLTAGVIGWWASWPAEPIDGYVITDHANPAAAAWMRADRRYWTADPAALRQMQRDALPPDLLPTLDRHWLGRDAFPWADFRLRSGLNEEQMRLLREAPWYQRTAYSWLKTFYAVDYPHFRLAQELSQTRPTDLLMLYLRGPDPVQHYAWDLVEPERFVSRPENLERDRGLVEGIYRYLDTFLEEILDSKHPETTLIVASDHGAEATPGYDHTAPASSGERPGSHSTSAQGILFIHGPDVRRGYELESGGSPLDLMPTMAWLLGLPVADDLDGRILTEAFAESRVRRPQVSRVATYGDRETSPALESPIDEALMEQLRALGYVN